MLVGFFIINYLIFRFYDVYSLIVCFCCFRLIAVLCFVVWLAATVLPDAGQLSWHPSQLSEVGGIGTGWGKEYLLTCSKYSALRGTAGRYRGTSTCQISRAIQHNARVAILSIYSRSSSSWSSSRALQRVSAFLQVEVARVQARARKLNYFNLIKINARINH